MNFQKSSPSSTTKRLRAARREVDALVTTIRRLDAPLLQFPRPVEEIAIICHDKAAVKFIRQEELSEKIVYETVEAKLGFAPVGINAGDVTPKLGFLYCHGRHVFIFYDPSRGETCARFTKAHELGHLCIEYMKALDRLDQLLLVPVDPPVAFGDTGLELLPGLGDADGVAVGAQYEDLYRTASTLRAEKSAWLREVKANAFAAELLAPYKEVQELIRDLKRAEDKVQLVRDTFGLSNYAARLRVSEVGCLPSKEPGDLANSPKESISSGEDEWWLVEPEESDSVSLEQFWSGLDE